MTNVGGLEDGSLRRFEAPHLMLMSLGEWPKTQSAAVRNLFEETKVPAQAY